MKRIALVAAVLVLAACSKKNDAAVDTAAMAPAPAAMDTAMKTMDSTMLKDSIRKDSITKDSIAKAGTKKK
jgi:uncharacterized lipoprotein YajG